MRSAVFLERDGILNTVRVERHHPVSPLTLDEFFLNPEAVTMVKLLKQAGLLVMVTTCQPGLSRGYQSRRDLALMHEHLRMCLPVDDIFVCPHDETDLCPCRKPKPGLLIEAAFKWHLELEQCFVVSEKWQDAEAARNAGCMSIMVQSPWNGFVHPDFVAENLRQAIAKIIQARAYASSLVRV